MAKISGRNKIPSTIKVIEHGGVMAKVVLGEKVQALIKATEIMVIADE